MEVSAVFSEYHPIKTFAQFEHPDPIIESLSLSCVELPQLLRNASLCANCMNPQKKRLSGHQLEMISYADQSHGHILPSGERQGACCADGTGCGKGRTIAGLIYCNYRNSRRKALWLSVNAGLRNDAVRDMKAVTGKRKIQVFSAPPLGTPIEVKKGVLFMSYTMLNSKEKMGANTRFKQVVEWLGPDFDGVIALDEAHKAKGFSSTGDSTACGTNVYLLQKCLPFARVLYVTATLASDPQDLTFMTRLGLWGKGCSFRLAEEFINFVNKRGITARELVPVELKQRGILMSRQLDLSGVQFEHKETKITKEFQLLYDACCTMWKLIHLATQQLVVDNPGKVQSAYWSSHQRFFKHLCVSSKVVPVVSLTRKSLANNMAVIIGIDSTGEAAMKYLRTSPYHHVKEACSTLRMILEQFMLKTLKMDPEDLGLKSKSNLDPRGPDTVYMSSRTVKRKKSTIETLQGVKKPKLVDVLESKGLHFGDFNESNFSSESEESDEEMEVISLDFDNVVDMVGNEENFHDLLCSQFKFVKKKLPLNTLDVLIAELGGHENVAEMTGRVNGQNLVDKEVVQKTTRESSLGGLNTLQQGRFQTGRVNIAIISQAASTGISLHSDQNEKNQRQRLHILMELPWSANVAIQQLGRSHRSNQVNTPKVKLVMSSVPGEKRFSQSVGRKIKSMGALTKGDCKINDTELWETHRNDILYLPKAVQMLLMAINGQKTDINLFPANKEYLRENSKLYARSVGLIHPELDKINKKCINPDNFFNRLLGLPIRIQKMFSSWIDVIVKTLKDNAEDSAETGLPTGIIDLDEVIKGAKNLVEVIPITLHSGSVAFMNKFVNVKGCSWQKLSQMSTDWQFYKEKKPLRIWGNCEVFAIERKSYVGGIGHYYNVLAPYLWSTERQNESFLSKLIKIDNVAAKKIWDAEFELFRNPTDTGAIYCKEKYIAGYCNDAQNGYCRHNKTLSHFAVLTHQIFETWRILENKFSIVQIVRYKDENVKVVGIYIAREHLKRLPAMLVGL